MNVFDRCNCVHTSRLHEDYDRQMARATEAEATVARLRERLREAREALALFAMEGWTDYQVQMGLGENVTTKGWMAFKGDLIWSAREVLSELDRILADAEEAQHG